MWREMHIGYEDRAEQALRLVLGNDYADRDLSWSIFKPWVDMPTDYGAIEHQPLPRLAIVIEGDADKLASVQEALSKLRPK